MSSILTPLTQLTTGQTIFAGVVGALNVASIGFTAYKASQASNVNLRVNYVAMACLQALNLGFGGVSYSGFVSGNVPVWIVGTFLSLVCTFAINKLQLNAQELERQQKLGFI